MAKDLLFLVWLCCEYYNNSKLNCFYCLRYKDTADEGKGNEMNLEEYSHCYFHANNDGYYYDDGDEVGEGDADEE